MKRFLRVAVAALIAARLALPACAQKHPTTGETKAQFEKRTKWWREARFGMFIHWGVYAVPADSSKGLAEWYMSNFQMQVADYERFVPRFNPVQFNAKQWVQVAKNAGMKYLVITSKHHDGFALFESDISPYCITKATPFRRDPLKELADECRKQGVKLCFYHSIMDWHHPDYLPRRPWEKNVRPATGANFDRYVDYMKAQLKELVTKYDPAVLWFDGEWEETWTHERAKDLYAFCKALKPSLLINNRIDKGRQGMQGMNASEQFLGDFGTPEQEVPPQGFTDGRLWETCMTLNDTWGYARNDQNWKSAEQLIRTLVDVAHKGGNYLLNVGPTELGAFPPETIDRLGKMGDWMKRNGKAIYGTTRSPFAKLPANVRCTQKGSTLYIHVWNWSEAGVTLPSVQVPARSARVLATKEFLKVTSGANGDIQIPKPSQVDPFVTVIELQFAAPLPRAN